MREVLTLPSAEADLAAIAIYTKERWGIEQAQKYLSGLRADIESLTKFPLMHPRHRSAHGEFRKAASGHHLVFYQIDDASITVVRVLHERMDFDEISG
tara:strand:+ start:815 stop:1108 length:294 start_codon:yes stop_codon:yes gene_type:complete